MHIEVVISIAASAPLVGTYTMRNATRPVVDALSQDIKAHVGMATSAPQHTTKRVLELRMVPRLWHVTLIHVLFTVDHEYGCSPSEERRWAVVAVSDVTTLYVNQIDDSTAAMKYKPTCDPSVYTFEQHGTDYPSAL